jgi:hypothetical protein
VANTPEATDRLKSCPCCGGKAEISEGECANYPKRMARVECLDCGLQTRDYYANNQLGCHDAENGLHRKDAASAWNTRAALKDDNGQ